MIEAKMEDIYGTTVEVCESNSGYFRIDLRGESFPQLNHPVTGENIPTCLSFDDDEARVLQAALNSFFKEG